ncbi:hypothetical protein CFBP5473_13395 [Agrobacterium larrymoorei]|uniref:RepB-like DNA primase domain-containing protein n=1 Tax=Agrobacterium larrymoorei TaxID=160699 RepID=A0A4D7DN01_9HYPH|nr:hypothetical protein CFBP5473_13395 [Agrobacterium larrymoorei]
MCVRCQHFQGLKHENLSSPKRTHSNSQLFRDLNDDDHIIRSQHQFLQDVCNDIAEGSYTFLAFKQVTTGKWEDHAIKNAGSWRETLDLLREYSRWDYDQYFCPNSFSEERRKQLYALPTSFGWCDIDRSEPSIYEPVPSILWETSPQSYQGLWLWDRTHRATDAELFSKSLAYRHGGDNSGWSATKMLRIPGSVNHKPQYNEPFVKIIKSDWSEITSRPRPLEGVRHAVASALPTIDANPPSMTVMRF